jgi:hypothetical protein
MVLFDSNPQSFTFGVGSSNVIINVDPQAGKKKYHLVVTAGKMKVNNLGPVVSNSGTCEVFTLTSEITFRSKRPSVIMYFEVVGEQDCSFTLTQVE